MPYLATHLYIATHACTHNEWDRNQLTSSSFPITLDLANA